MTNKKKGRLYLGEKQYVYLIFTFFYAYIAANCETYKIHPSLKAQLV